MILHFCIHLIIFSITKSDGKRANSNKTTTAEYQYPLRVGLGARWAKQLHIRLVFDHALFFIFSFFSVVFPCSRWYACMFGIEVELVFVACVSIHHPLLSLPVLFLFA